MLQESASSELIGASRGCVMKKITRIALMAAGFLTPAILSGCGSTASAPTPPPPAISISFTGSNSQTISQGQSVTLTVTVSNDSSGKGVTWSLSGQGALSKQSGTSVQYDAPTSVASTVTAMVTATSGADTTRFATATITINPPPPPISISFIGGNSQTILQGQSITLTVTVSNDSSGKGVTWSLSGQGALSKQSGTSVQYDAPASVASTVTAMVTATSVADTTKFATATITIPPPLAISPTALPDGVVGTPYSQDIQATGGVAPFTWIISAGILPHNLNLDNSTTSTVTISGTPDTQQTAVQFTIQVADSANQSATQSYTVTINNPPTLTIATSSVPPGTINVAYPSF